LFVTFLFHCIALLVVVVLVVAVVILSPKSNLNTHRVSFKSVPNTFNISYRHHVYNSRSNNRATYTQYIGIITMSLPTTVYAVHQLPSVNP
jgi:hypothetical protein